MGTLFYALEEPLYFIVEVVFRVATHASVTEVLGVAASSSIGGARDVIL